MTVDGHWGTSDAGAAAVGMGVGVGSFRESGVPEASGIVMVKMLASQEAVRVKGGGTSVQRAAATWLLPLERMRTQK